MSAAGQGSMPRARYQIAPIARVDGAAKAGGSLPRVAEPTPGQGHLFKLRVGTQRSGKMLLGVQGGAGLYFELKCEGDSTISGEIGGYEEIEASVDAVPEGFSAQATYDVSWERSGLDTTGSINQSLSVRGLTLDASIGLGPSNEVSSIKLSLGLPIGKSMMAPSKDLGMPPFNKGYSVGSSQETPIFSFGNDSGSGHDGRPQRTDLGSFGGGRPGSPNNAGANRGSGGEQLHGGPKPGGTESEPESKPPPEPTEPPTQPSIPNRLP